MKEEKLNPWTPEDEGDHYPIMKEWWTTEIIFKTPRDNRKWNLITSFAYKMENKECFFQYVLFDITNGKVVANKEIDDKIEKLNHEKNKIELKYERSTLSGNYPKYRLHIEDEKQDIEIDVEYKAEALPHWVAQDKTNGYLPIGLNYYRYGFLPRCNVKGNMKLKDEKYEIQGIGYLEHAYGNWSYQNPFKKLSDLRKTISIYAKLGKWWISENKPKISDRISFTTENNIFGYDWIWGVFDNGGSIFFGNSMFWINHGPSLGALYFTKDGKNYLEFCNVKFNYNKSIYIKEYDIFYPCDITLDGILDDKKIHMRFWKTTDEYEYFSPFKKNGFYKALVLCGLPGSMQGFYMEDHEKIELSGDCKIVPLRQPSVLGHNSLKIDFLKPPNGIGLDLELDSHYFKKIITGKIHFVPHPNFKFNIKRIKKQDFLNTQK